MPKTTPLKYASTSDEASSRSSVTSPAMRSLMYAASTLMSPALGFLLLPLYARHMSPSNYGLMATVDLFSTYLGLAVNAGFSNALLRYYNEQADDAWKRTVFSTCFCSALGSGCVALLLVSAALATLEQYVDLDLVRVYLLIGSATVALETLNMCVWTLYRVVENARRALLVTISRLAVAVILNVLFIVVFELKVLGFLLSNLLVASFVLFTFSAPQVVNHWARPNKVLWKKMMSFALPYIPIGFIEAFVNNLGIICLTMTGSLSAVGLFAIGAKIASIITMSYAPINTVWMPLMYKRYKQPDAIAFYSRSTTYVLIFVMSVTVIVIGLGVPLLLAATPQAYSGAAYVIAPLSLGTGIYALRTNVRVGFTLEHRTHLLPLYTVIPVALAFPVTLYLSWKIGSSGAAYGVALAMALTILLTGRKSREYFSAQYEWPRFLRLFLVVVVAIVLLTRTSVDSVFIRTALVLGYIASLFVFRVLSAQDIRTVVSWFRPIPAQH